MLNFSMKQLPFAEWIDAIVDWLTDHLSGLFTVLRIAGEAVMNFMTMILTAIPPFVMMAILVIAAFFVFKRKWGFAAFTLVGLLFIYNQRYVDRFNEHNHFGHYFQFSRCYYRSTFRYPDV